MSTGIIEVDGVSGLITIGVPDDHPPPPPGPDVFVEGVGAGVTDGEVTLILNVVVVVFPAVSDTLISTSQFHTLVGVPDILPVVGSNVSPSGR